MVRFIGIQHRVKKSAEGESRPTIVQVLGGKRSELDNEDDELTFIGSIEAGDTIAMALGGSGDYLAFAASRIAQEKGAEVIRIPPYALKQERTKRGFDRNKKEDAALLALLAQEAPYLFYPVADRDRALILVREHYRARIDAMKARIACEQRIRQRIIGGIFCRSDGLYPEGGIEKAFDEAKANDTIYQAVLVEEKRRNGELEKACKALDVYRQVFAPIEGMGPALASRIIANVTDIRQFATESAFKAFCGVHVLADGRFPRRRNNEVANWSGDCRQALYLFVADQCNKRPDSYWGKYLKQMKANLRAKHPEAIKVDGKKKYSDGHIHKMAIWRTATRLAEHLYKKWWELDGGAAEARRLAA